MELTCGRSWSFYGADLRMRLDLVMDSRLGLGLRLEFMLE
jgi:hypothetical protein